MAVVVLFSEGGLSAEEGKALCDKEAEKNPIGVPEQRQRRPGESEEDLAKRTSGYIVSRGLKTND